MDIYEPSQHTIQIDLIASLGKDRPPQAMLTISPKDTVMDVIQRLGIKVEMVQMAFADGKFINFDTVLDSTERLLLLPAIGGG